MRQTAQDFQRMKDDELPCLSRSRRRRQSCVNVTAVARQRSEGTQVFIGHGSSRVWLALKGFWTERLGVECDEFNAEAVGGISTTARLQAMLDHARFAFLVMTGEDRHADGVAHARENVIH